MIEEENCIDVQGAKVHNLKNIDVKIPRDELVVITGLSGSGKSCLHLIPFMLRSNVAIWKLFLPMCVNFR